MQRLKFCFSLLIILLLCSCFSSDAKKSTSFVLNKGDKNLLINMHDFYRVSIASPNELESEQTINIEIVSNNKDANNNDIVRISSKKVLLSPYISESFVSIYSNNSPGNVTVKFSANGDESNAQYLNVKVSNMAILVDGDTQNIDSPIYLPDVSATPGLQENPQITRAVPIEIKSPNNVLNSKNFKLEISTSPRTLPNNIDIKPYDNPSKTKGDTVAYWLKIVYTGNGLFPSISVNMEITDISRGKTTKINKRIVPINVNNTQYETGNFSFISIYDNKGIFMTANEGKVDVPLKIFMNSNTPDVTDINYTVTATIYSGGNEVNFGIPGEKAINFQAQNFTTNMISLYPVSKSDNGIDLNLKVADDNGYIIFTQTIKMVVLRADNQNIIVNSYIPTTGEKMLISNPSGVLSFYIPSNQRSYEEDTGGISIVNNNLNLSTSMPMSSHKMYYIPYSINADNGYAINNDDSEAIKFIIGSKTLVTSQPLNYIINPIIAYSYLDIDQIKQVQMNSNNSLDFPLLNNSTEPKSNNLGIILGVPNDQKFRERLFKILFNSDTCHDINISVKPEGSPKIAKLYNLSCNGSDPTSDLIIKKVDNLPAGPKNYSAVITVEPDTKYIKEKIGINFLDIKGDGDTKISIDSRNIVPATQGSNPYFFFLNKEPALTTVSLDTQSPSLAVSLNFIYGNTNFTATLSNNCQGSNNGNIGFSIRLSKRFPSCQFSINYNGENPPPSLLQMGLYLTSYATMEMIDTSYSFKYKTFTTPVCIENITLGDGGTINNINVSNKTYMVSNIAGFAPGQRFILKGQNFYSFTYNSSYCSSTYPQQFQVSAKLEKHFIGNGNGQFLWVAMDNYLLDDPETPSFDRVRGLFFTQGPTNRLIGSGVTQCLKPNDCTAVNLRTKLNSSLEDSYKNDTHYTEGLSPMGLYYENQTTSNPSQITTFTGLLVELNHADINAQNQNWIAIHDLDTQKDSCEKGKTCDSKVLTL